MVKVIKNPLDPSDHKELEEALALLFDDYKERHDKWNSKSPSLPSVLPNWEDNLTRERLNYWITSRKRPVDTAKEKHSPRVPWRRLTVEDTQQKVFDVLGGIYNTEVTRRNDAVWYNPTNYLGWHTNWRVPGRRMYLIYTNEQDGSFFRYYDKVKDEIIDCYDDKGLTVRQFDVSAEDPLWHCVGCRSGNRLSCGFMLK